MKDLIIGSGEVGKSLHEIVSAYNPTLIRDIEPIEINEEIGVMHICYPDSDNFVEITKGYIEQYKPALTIINSSVSVGTTRKCGDLVVYSPIRGRHPDNGLSKEMKIYPKFVSAVDYFSAHEAQEYFIQMDWDVFRSEKPEDLEYLKLMSNIHMGIEIAWRQEIQRMMSHFNIDQETYEIWEKTYSDGYRELGQYHLIRPQMRPNAIGGHCILPCTEILSKQFPSKIFDFVLESNEKAKREAK